MCLSSVEFAHEVVRKHHSKGSISNMLTGLQNSISQTQRGVPECMRASLRYLRERARSLSCLPSLELIFKTGVGIEVRFDGFLTV